jgi:hypothetical protein
MTDTLPVSAGDSTGSGYTATYSPDDNKLRLYAASRLPADVYARVTDAGFRRAPRQDLFFATWSPGAEDLALELAGVIDDEDTSLVERAATRAERFEGYSERRLAEAERAREAVTAIAEHIPLGQPILVGHHSEKRARRDAEKIQNGMRKAVHLWETSKYWTSRAAGAIRHAKYKERPDVRYRRIKTIEADKRKRERARDEAVTFSKLWSRPDLTREQALKIANYDHISRCFPLADFPRSPPASQHEGSMSLWSALDGNVIDEKQASAIAIEAHARTVARAERWLAHFENRLTYERAMLNETAPESVAAAVDSQQLNIEVGGRVRVRGEWLVVTRVNRKDGKVCSVSTNARYVRVKGIEEVQEYRAPEAGDAQKVAAATKLAPLCNYPGDGIADITKAQWDRICRDMKATRTCAATETHGAHRVRTAVMGGRLAQVFITDAKRVDPPARRDPPPTLDRGPAAPVTVSTPAPRPAPSVFEAMKASLRQGVTVVATPQLFPTPAALAERLVDEAGISDGMTVLEPSAGTGAILKAIRGATRSDAVQVTAVEVRRDFTHLNGMADRVHFGDFTECGAELGYFDRILMNPPFENGADVTHVTHALRFLKDGGRLLAIMSAGVTFRQDRRTADFRRLVDERGGTIEALPDDAFKESGTQVRTVLVTIDA